MAAGHVSENVLFALRESLKSNRSEETNKKQFNLMPYPEEYSRVGLFQQLEKIRLTY